MPQRIDIQGRSGRVYAFFRPDEAALRRPIGVTYVIAAKTAAGWRVLRVGHVSNLADRNWSDDLAAARAAEPAAELLLRLNISRAIREAEAADLAHLAGSGPGGPPAGT